MFVDGWDDPEFIQTNLVKEHKRIVSGYGSLVKKGIIEEGKLRETLNPLQVALSLSGEPTIYPRLGELIEGFKRKGLTVFLVTSGVLPRALEELLDGKGNPSQLYISLTGWDKESYEKINRPTQRGLWNSLLRSLELASQAKCQSIIRITLIEGVNSSPEALKGFANIINRVDIPFVELKGYMYVGYSMKRLRKFNMPTEEEVKRSANKLNELIGYDVVSFDSTSRVALLGRNRHPRRFD